MASALDNIASVVISRETASVAKANFGIPAIIAPFATTKTTVDFVRYRYYSSLTEMSADGWASTDAVYKAAQRFFAQNPKVQKVMVGRIDDLDADVTAALAAIKAAQSQWYAFILLGDQAGDPAGTPLDADTKLAAAWAETEMKIFFYFSVEAGAKAATTTDLIAFMKAQNYERTVGFYYDPDAENATDGTMGDYVHAAAPGEALPYDPGSQTWCYKTLSGVAAYELTTTERDNVLGKNGNIYTVVANVSCVEEGKTASGEWIDVIRGIDWITASLQETIFEKLASVRKIAFTDAGITIIEGIIRGVLSEAARMGIITEESIVITVPKAADVSSSDKQNRLLPDVSFEATLQGAIHKTTISGTITV